MCVNVNTLPEECLLLVFDQIPLPKLLRLDRVCHLWAFLLPSATARRRTLVLNVGGLKMDESNFVIPFNDHKMEMPTDGGRPYYDLPVAEREAAFTFILPPKRPKPDGPAYTEMARLLDARLHGRLVNYLAILLPNVHTLVVVHPNCIEADLHLLVRLLRSWSLVTLKLWLQTREIDQRYVHHPDKHPVGTLLRTINSLAPSLRQLTLEIRGQPIKDNQVELPEYTFPIEWFAFISQLKVAKLCLLLFDSTNFAQPIWETMHRFDSANLEQIALGTWYPIEAAINPQFEFATKVRQLFYFRRFESVEQLSEVCLRFTCLTVFQLYWTKDITFTELVANLSSLRQLTQLKVHIHFKDHPPNLFALVNDDQEPRPISLEQVKFLEFNIKKHTHQDFESLSPMVFPSIEMAILRELAQPNPEPECIICRPNGGPLNLKMDNRCHQLLLCSLSNKVTTNSSVRLYPAPDPVSNTERLLDALEHFIVFIVVMAILIGILAY